MTVSCGPDTDQFRLAPEQIALPGSCLSCESPNYDPFHVRFEPFRPAPYKSSFLDRVEYVSPPYPADQDGFTVIDDDGEVEPPAALTPDEQIRAERYRVYGDPLENHRGIAQMWAPLLQPYWRTICDGEPIPPHVVALMMVALKLDRMRLVYHQDNYADLRNYLSFAEEWQKSACNPPEVV